MVEEVGDEIDGASGFVAVEAALAVVMEHRGPGGAIRGGRGLEPGAASASRKPLRRPGGRFGIDLKRLDRSARLSQQNALPLARLDQAAY